MAYMKFKELTKYFDFNEEIDKKELPKYVLDYLDDGEEIYKAYRTKRDKAIFTNKKMVLFDVDPVFNSKKIHIIPYYSISSGSVEFGNSDGSIQLAFDSGYQIRLDFVKLDSEEKTQLRLLYMYMMNTVIKKTK
ncbi:MAG TPA: PH domain-containing protein [Bacilli bacterium]|nr:PH domain-containing protein [Bacilli bacterium]HQC83508.1 PH domain-containing protein [Bacilli bacterium]